MFELIKRYEGCVLHAYPDPVTKGKPYTIGYGSTIYPNGKEVKEDDVITEEQADVMLTDYLLKNVYWIFNKIPHNLTLNQKRAIASLVYNVGANAFMKSKLYKAICNKDYATICKEWDFGFKHNLKGLYKRRTEELYLFIQDI